MVLESLHKNGENQDATPEPPNRRYSFFDRYIWDKSAGGEGSVMERREIKSQLTMRNG